MPSRGGPQFEEALRVLQSKVALPPDEYKKLSELARQKAFTVGGITRLDILQDLLNELQRTITEGQTLQEFKANIRNRMAEKGWRGTTPYRLETIFRTNLQTAFQVGRYQQMKRPEVVEMRPYWLYDAVNDGATRPSHRALDGMVRRHDDPFWEEWYPPNGFNCRCRVIPLSAEAVARRGLTIQSGDLPKSWDKETGEILQMSPDKGFGVNPATAWEPDLSRFDEDVKKAYQGNQ